MTPTVITVKQLNFYVKSMLESDGHLSSLYLSGEISNFKDHYQSGHLYFSLKDSDAVIRAVMFRSSAAHLRFNPCDGMRVICRGRVSLYERDGSYQFYAEEMVPDGIGELSLAFEQTKEKLNALGLFDVAHKKPIPKFPRRIAVITSDTGAAVQDILNITSRRFPQCEIVLCPVKVQGDGAVRELTDALKRVGRLNDIDTVIIGRGGGSIEDLWAFNSEELAMEMFACPIPVISAVGHETDFTIADFVADLRAPTPSAAAELAVPDREKLFEKINSLTERLKYAENRYIFDATLCMKKYGTGVLQKALVGMYDICAQRLDILTDRLSAAMRNAFASAESDFKATAARLGALNPLSVLTRGYSVVTKDGKTVGAETLSLGDQVEVRFSDGTAQCTVNSVERI